MIYLDTASVGIPPPEAAEAMRRGIEEWASGRASPPDYDALIADCRTAFAALVGCQPDQVAITTPVSVASAQVRGVLESGARVLLAEEDFTSVLFPFLDEPGIEPVIVPLDQLMDRIGPDIDLVAVSLVQSADGRLLDPSELAARCRAAQTLSYVDLTQGAGWVEVEAAEFDFTATGAYKWLACPRGVGFLTVHPRWWDRLSPLAPGWYAGDDPWQSTYRPPRRLAADARRFDLSPAWLPFVGAAPALEHLRARGVDAVRAHDLALANRFRAGLGLAPGDSPIVSLPLDEPALARLRAADVRVAARDGRTRLSFHLHNTETEVDRVLELIGDPGQRFLR